MRNGAAQDQFDGIGDDLVGKDGDEVHELELDDLDAWEDETSAGDPAPHAAPSTTKPAGKTSTPRGGKR